jgi:diguanylate cyclase (GGDEF)-like protein
VSGRTFATWPRVAGLAASSSALVASSLAGGPPLAAAGAICLWAVTGWYGFGLTGFLAAGIPGLALLGGGWPTLVAWTVAGLAGGLAGRAAADRESIWSARDAVRDAERERRELLRHNQRYPVLLEACLEFSSARDLDQLADILVRRTRDLVDDLDRVLVFLGPADRPACLASADAEGEPCAVSAGPDECYVSNESRPLIRREGALMHALLPLRGDRRRDDGREAQRGVLSVRFHLDDLGDRLALDLIGALSRLAGIGLATVDLLGQARSLALRDSLTGLFGRQEFLRRLDEHVSSARRERTSLAVVMCDLDRLKAYNDRYGHPAGDAALTLVARSLATALPEESILCRYGGEEFAALIPGVDRESIRTICEAVRAAVAETVLVEEDPQRRVTTSVGFALLAPDENGADCLGRADQAVYAAKANGRNRVEAAP